MLHLSPLAGRGRRACAAGEGGSPRARCLGCPSPQPSPRKNGERERTERAYPAYLTTSSHALLRRLRSQALRIDVDDEGREQNEAADKDFQEAVDVDVVEPVVEDAEHEQPNDGVADAAAPAEQAG